MTLEEKSMKETSSLLFVYAISPLMMANLDLVSEHETVEQTD
jgi:hypothetical protein